MLEWIAERLVGFGVVVVAVALVLAWLDPQGGMPYARSPKDQRGRAG